ncbi:MAG: DUF6316 family protein [Gammaproteobacteria bacterium]|nr:DUF6316 family protein [Gammaproteobacteria bacterium]
MEQSLPAWFRADEVFAHEGSWYLGSVESLYIGPYDDRKTAETKAVVVAKELGSMRTVGTQLRYVRQLLHEEWQEIGKAGYKKCDAGENASLPGSGVRSGEVPKNWNRSQRFFKVGGVWFFSTREGIDVGPFGTENEAKKQERQLISLLGDELTSQQVETIIQEYKYRAPQLVA